MRHLFQGLCCRNTVKKQEGSLCKAGPVESRAVLIDPQQSEVQEPWTVQGLIMEKKLEFGVDFTHGGKVSSRRNSGPSRPAIGHSSN